jgi:pimeloyl-ACP methyl ester carboxylesterase
MLRVAVAATAALAVCMVTSVLPSSTPLVTLTVQHALWLLVAVAAAAWLASLDRSPRAAAGRPADGGNRGTFVQLSYGTLHYLYEEPASGLGTAAPVSRLPPGKPQGGSTAPAATRPVAAPLLKRLVVLVHGFSTDMSIYDGLAAALVADGHPVLRFDQPVRVCFLGRMRCKSAAKALQRTPPPTRDHSCYCWACVPFPGVPVWGKAGAAVSLGPFPWPSCSVAPTSLCRARGPPTLAVRRLHVQGRGYSQAPEAAQPQNLALYVSTLTELLFVRGVSQPFDLVGFSLGGAVAMAFAHQHPDRVARLVLLAPAGLPITPPVSARFVHLPLLGNLFYLLAPRTLQGGIVAEFARYPAAAAAAGPLVQAFRDSVTRNPVYLRSLLSTLRHFPLSTLDLGVVRGVGAHPRPVLLVWGEGDTLVPYSNAARLAAMLPRVKLVSVADAAHTAILQQAQVVVGSIVDFLQCV